MSKKFFYAMGQRAAMTKNYQVLHSIRNCSAWVVWEVFRGFMDQGGIPTIATDLATWHAHAKHKERYSDHEKRFY